VVVGDTGDRHVPPTADAPGAGHGSALDAAPQSLGGQAEAAGGYGEREQLRRVALAFLLPVLGDRSPGARWVLTVCDPSISSRSPEARRGGRRSG